MSSIALEERSTGVPVSHWRDSALRCRELATSGQREAAQSDFLELNRQIGSYLLSGGTLTDDLDRLLDEVAAWQGETAPSWHWRFHHALSR
jgi:hypothetical protein